MQFDYTTRVKTGMILIVLFALFSNLRLLTDWVQFDLSFLGQDEVTLYLKRFDDVKRKLPQTGVIGFVSSNRNGALSEISTDGASLREWFLAQYSLVPLVLSPTPGHKLTLIEGRPGDNNSLSADSNSEDEPRLTTQGARAGAKIVEFESGVKLLLR